MDRNTITTIVAPSPVGLPGLAVLLVGLVLFVAALLFVRWRVGSGRGAAVSSKRSAIGMWLQAAGFFLVSIGPLRPTLQPAAAAAVGQAVAVGLLIGFCISLFMAAAIAMGRNWSFVARVRQNHDLVTWGPFATIRHPIYTGLAAMLLAIAVAFGHWRGLAAGVPLFALGTWIRVTQEERLLRNHFGRQYEAYAQRVRRFIPRLF